MLILVGRASLHSFDFPPIPITPFLDGEFFIQNMRESETTHPKETPIVFIQSLSPPIHDNLLELIMACEAYQKHPLIACLPYLAYSRQDKEDQSGLRCVAKMLKNAGIQKIVTLDVHSPRCRDFFDIPFVDLDPFKILKNVFPIPQCLIAPDRGSIFRADKVSKLLDRPVVVCDKRNLPKTLDVQNQSCMIIDDIVDSGWTISVVAHHLKKNHASSVSSYATHGILSKMDCLSYIDRLYLTDSIHVPKHPKITILKIKYVIEGYFNTYSLFVK